MRESKALLELVMDACEDRKAEHCVALDMKALTPMTDYYVICHGNNERQVQAIAKFVKETAEEREYPVLRVEGLHEARWILIDLGDVVCHVFHKDERNYYSLERLWGDAPQIETETMPKDGI